MNNKRSNSCIVFLVAILTTVLSEVRGQQGPTNSPPQIVWIYPGMDPTTFDNTVNNVITQYSANGVDILLNGTSFATRGTIVIPNNYPYFRLRGNGKDSTTLQVQNPAEDPNGIFYAIGGSTGGSSGWVHKFAVADLTIDCGATNNPHLANRTNTYKIGGIHAKCSEATISNVRVKNFGGRGLPNLPCGNQGTEVFPLIVTTNYKPAPNGPRINIYGCEVRDFTAVQGAYCTAIMVNTSYWDYFNNVWMPINNDTPGSVPAEQTIARVYSNFVTNVLHGIAYGTARSHNVVFEWNLANNVKTGFNCDTWESGHGQNWTCQNIRLSGNQFLNCNEGINVGAPGWGQENTWLFTKWTITDNEISLKGPYNSNTHSYIFQLNGGNSYTTLAGNYAHKTVSFYPGYLVRTGDPNLACGSISFYDSQTFANQSGWPAVNTPW